MQHVKNSGSLSQQQGFTLLELLIASVIFAIMALMAYGGLANVIDNSQSSQQSLQRLQQIQQSVAIISRDFSQIIRRDIRDEYGNKQTYLNASNNIDYLVEFSRGGRVNPAQILRSTLLRVAYQFDDEKLIRLQWPQLDRAPGIDARQTVVLDDIEDVTLRFLDKDGEWQEQWPPLNAATGADGGDIVELFAIEVVLQLKDWGDIRRLYAMN